MRTKSAKHRDDRYTTEMITNHRRDGWLFERGSEQLLLAVVYTTRRSMYQAPLALRTTNDTPPTGNIVRVWHSQCTRCKR